MPRARGRMILELLGDGVDDDGNETGSLLMARGSIGYRILENGTIAVRLKIDHSRPIQPAAVKRPPSTDEP